MERPTSSRNSNAQQKKSRSSRSASRAQSWKKGLVTKRSLNGGKMRLGPNPPEVTYQPWNPVTLVKQTNKSLDIKVSDLSTILKLQIDPTKRGLNQITDKSRDDRFIVQFRVLSIRAWNLTGRVISLSVEDWTDTKSGSGGRDQLCGLIDTGSNVHTPAVGFSLPSTHRHHVLRTDDIENDVIVFHIGCGSNEACIIYVDVLYRFDGPVTIPTFFSFSNHVISKISATNKFAKKTVESVDQLNGTADTIREIASSARDALDELKLIAQNTEASKPSTVSKITNGVEKIAMLVSALAFEDSESSYSVIQTDTED